MIRRFFHDLGKYSRPRKVLIIYGPRRAGKTTLLEEYLPQSGLRYRLDSGDNIRIQQLLGSQDFTRLTEYAHGYELLAIDEAQQIPNIGIALKILVDQLPGIRIVATGSSSFDLSQSVGEPLTGRKRTLELFPISQSELLSIYSKGELRDRLEEFLVFGHYPEILLTAGKADKIELLRELVDSYLLRDILTLDRVKGPEPLLKLVKLLAFQVGQLVSVAELAVQLHLDQKTVARYIDLLERSFVIRRLGGFSRNLRKEISKRRKIYFLDTGVRNAVIGHFHSLADRQDVGALWENFLFAERLKRAAYMRDYASRYFWRTYDHQEIDFVEEKEGELSAYEAKWSGHRKAVAPAAWNRSYPDASFEVVTPENYQDFVLC